MRPLEYVIGTYSAADPNVIAVAQAVVGGVPMTLTTTPFLMGARPVVITPAADESGNRFLIHGAGVAGNEIYESVAGGNAVATESLQIFGTVYSVTPELDGAGNVEVGTGADRPSPWIPLNWSDTHFNARVSLEVVGTVVTGAVLQATMDDLRWENRGGHHGSLFDMVYPIQNIIDITTDVLGSGTIGSDTLAEGVITSPFTAIRAVSQEALDAAESVTLKILQGHRS